MPIINKYSGGGGIIPQLPEQVDTCTIEKGALSFTLTWLDPVDDENDSYAGVRIIRKEGSCPESVTDGTVVYDGTANTYTDSGLTEGITYYYRFFSYNADGKYQNSMRYVYETAANLQPVTVQINGGSSTISQYATIAYDGTDYSQTSTTLTVLPGATFSCTVNTKSSNFAASIKVNNSTVASTSQVGIAATYDYIIPEGVTSVTITLSRSRDAYMQYYGIITITES